MTSFGHDTRQTDICVRPQIAISEVVGGHADILIHPHGTATERVIFAAERMTGQIDRVFV